MRKILKCGQLFTGLEETARRDQTLVIEGDRIAYVGPAADAPAPQAGDETIDYADDFVMPGLIDNHIHLTYGNAQANEDIDMYSSTEFRALRSLLAAQKVLKSGYTSMADPATTGKISPAVRDAINAGMFEGPRITSSGRQITSRQGLGDWYPSWIGVPESSVGVLVRNVAEAIDEIRLQVKDRVDFLKFTVDGLNRNAAGELMCCFNQAELSAMIEECHRLGYKTITHARGREGVLFSARAGVDIIFHAFEMDDECFDALVESGATLLPSFTFLFNTLDFTQPSDPCYKWRPDMYRRDLESALEWLTKARKAGVPFMVGTDSGFAVTPYGEWSARELQIMVDHLGFSAGEALKCTTSGNAKLLREGDQVGQLTAGAFADVLVAGKDPIADIGVLQKRETIKDVYLGGKLVDLSPAPDFNPYPWEHSFRQWNDTYTRDRVAELTK